MSLYRKRNEQRRIFERVVARLAKQAILRILMKALAMGAA